jgi:hypothetical protein
MKINRDKNKGHHYLDENGAVVSTRGPGYGRMDSLGRTALAALIYDEDSKELSSCIENFFTLAKSSADVGYHLYAVRYPGNGRTLHVGGNSRDHVLKAVAVKKTLGDDQFVKTFLNNRAKRPAIFQGYTFDQKIWMKALYSNFWSWVYAGVMIPRLLFSWAVVNPLINTLTGARKTSKNPSEHWEFQQEFGFIKKPLLYKVKVPTYARFYTAVTLQAIHNRMAKKLTMLALRGLFEKHNYVGRALCGEAVKFPEEYIPPRGARWSTRLDRFCDRSMRPYPEDDASCNIDLGLFVLFKEIIEVWCEDD